MTFPYTLVDLTHTMHPDMPSWNGGCGFQSEIKLDYDPHMDPSFRVQQIKVHAGIGTHVDFPSHCVPGGRSAHELPVEEMLSPCVVIDVREASHARYTVTVSDIQTFEQQYGPIPPQACVMIWTGWSRFWNSSTDYRNDLVFPSVGKDAAVFLREQRRARALGIDTLSPDRPEDGFPVHEIFLKADCYLIENVAHLETMPAVGAFVLTLPIKGYGCTESPARCVGLIPHALKGQVL